MLYTGADFFCFVRQWADMVPIRSWPTKYVSEILTSNNMEREVYNKQQFWKLNTFKMIK